MRRHPVVSSAEDRLAALMEEYGVKLSPPQ
jgi:hypothetical protein